MFEQLLTFPFVRREKGSAALTNARERLKERGEKLKRNLSEEAFANPTMRFLNKVESFDNAQQAYALVVRDAKIEEDDAVFVSHCLLSTFVKNKDLQGAKCLMQAVDRL